MTSAADQKVLDEAQARFDQVQTWEKSARNNFRADQRMDAADSVNNYAWPDELYRPRIDAEKCCLTVNKVHQHVLNVVNDTRQNRPSIDYKPMANGATFKAAEVLNGLAKHIEAASSAEDAYDCATTHQTVGGIGYFRLCTEYADPKSFDLDIRIRRVTNPLSIYLDMDAKELDASDMMYAFAFVDWSKAQFDKKYPKYKDQVAGSPPLGSEREDYRDQATEQVRVCEYFRRVEQTDTLHRLDDGSDVMASDLPDDFDEDSIVKSRKVSSYKVEWYLLAGSDTIVDRNIWPGTLIPICRVLGEERVIDGKLDRIGLVRSMLDSARIYNVMNSAAVEAVGMQTSVPWLVTPEAVEGNETFWEAANRKKYAYLPWNSWDDAGAREVPKPERIDPPTYPQAYQQGIAQAGQDMMAASGQFEASFGQESNERSGKAINARVKNSNNATFHFVNNLAVAVRYAGRIILELIPIIYDSPGRILKVLGEDGTQSTVAIDPTMPTAHRDVNGADDESFTAQQVAVVLNPSIGDYSVIATAGPGYATQRAEAFNAISQILMQNESLSAVVGDLLFRSADFPLADEIAERLKNMVPPQALGQGPSPDLQQAQMHLAQQHQVLQAQAQEIAQLKSKAMSTEIQKELDDFKAQTERLKVIGGIDRDALMPVIRELVSQVMQQPINPLINAHIQENAAMIQATQPMPQPPQQPPSQLQQQANNQ